jgi:hypothetical protein
MGQIATGGGRISPPWPLGWIAATPRPLGVDRSHWAIHLFFFFFFFFEFAGSPERQIRPLRVAGSLPLAVGVDRSHP